MALSNQSPGSLRGVTPLAYAGTTPNMVFNTRRPIAKDVFNFELGTWWIIPKKKSGASASDPTREVWILVGNAQQTASWKQLHGGSGPTETSSVKVTVLDTPGSGTFTFDPSMYQVQVECVGGGGGAPGSSGSVTSVSSGSGGGAYVFKLYSSSQVGLSQAYTVGSGGAGGVPTGPGTFPAGSNGGNSAFGAGLTLITAGGGAAAGSFGTNVIGAGGIASGGDLNINGQDGISFFVTSAPDLIYGSGGSSGKLFGSGGQFNVYQVSGLPGKPYGGGASGSFSSTSFTGKSGADGVIIVTEYLS